MSMDKSRLGAAIATAVKNAPTGGSEADMQARWEAVAGAVIDEITNHATIAPLPGTHAGIAGAGVHVHPLITTLPGERKIS